MELLNSPADYERSRGNLPELPIINMFAEASSPEGKIILQSRPGLSTSSSGYSTAIKQLFSEPSVFNGDIFALAGTNFYRNGSLIGSINGNDTKASIDAYRDTVFITAGDDVWAYNGTSLTAVPFPDGANTGRLLVASSRLVVTKRDTQRLYWSDPLGTTIDALSFAEAENSPDDIEEMLSVGDALILFGEATTEFWRPSPDPDAPFTPVVGRVYSKGIRAAGCATLFGDSFAWITNENKICVETPNNIISTVSQENDIQISDSGTIRLWTFYLDNIEFLAASTDAATWVYCATSGLWSRFTKGTNEGLWEPHCHTRGYFGSRDNGRVLAWSVDNDDVGTVFERRFRVYQPLSVPTVILHNVTLRTNPGQTTSLPNVEMRMSKDGGQTWGNWRASSLGASGAYRTYVRWLANGIFSLPGMLLEFRVIAAIPFRVSSVLANEPYGGF